MSDFGGGDGMGSGGSVSETFATAASEVTEPVSDHGSGDSSSETLVSSPTETSIVAFGDANDWAPSANDAVAAQGETVTDQFEPAAEEITAAPANDAVAAQGETVTDQFEPAAEEITAPSANDAVAAQGETVTDQFEPAAEEITAAPANDAVAAQGEAVTDQFEPAAEEITAAPANDAVAAQGEAVTDQFEPAAEEITAAPANDAVAAQGETVTDQFEPAAEEITAPPANDAVAAQGEAVTDQFEPAAEEITAPPANDAVAAQGETVTDQFEPAAEVVTAPATDDAAAAAQAATVTDQFEPTAEVVTVPPVDATAPEMPGYRGHRTQNYGGLNEQQQSVAPAALAEALAPGNYSMSGSYTVDLASGAVSPQMQGWGTGLQEAYTAWAQEQAGNDLLAQVARAVNPDGTLVDTTVVRDSDAMKSALENTEEFDNREKAFHAVEMTLDDREDIEKLAATSGNKQLDSGDGLVTGLALISVLGYDTVHRLLSRRH